MAVRTLVAPMPGVTMYPGMVLKLEAINPTTGAAVSGVTASAWSIYGNAVIQDAAGGDLGTVGPFMFVPGPDPAPVQ